MSTDLIIQGGGRRAIGDGKSDALVTGLDRFATIYIKNLCRLKIFLLLGLDCPQKITGRDIVRHHQADITFDRRILGECGKLFRSLFKSQQLVEINLKKIYRLFDTETLKYFRMDRT